MRMRIQMQAQNSQARPRCCCHGRPHRPRRLQMVLHSEPLVRLPQPQPDTHSHLHTLIGGEIVSHWGKRGLNEPVSNPADNTSWLVFAHLLAMDRRRRAHSPIRMSGALVVCLFSGTRGLQIANSQVQPLVPLCMSMRSTRRPGWATPHRNLPGTSAFARLLCLLSSDVCDSADLGLLRLL